VSLYIIQGLRCLNNAKSLQERGEIFIVYYSTTELIMKELARSDWINTRVLNADLLPTLNNC
jgi:hypothetical protein